MKIATLASLLTLTVATSAFAVDIPAPLAAGPQPTPLPAGKREPAIRGDLDRDGLISREEWRERGDKLFDEIDTNHDGQVSAEERKAHWSHKRSEQPRRRAPKPPVAPTPAGAPVPPAPTGAAPAPAPLPPAAPVPAPAPVPAK